MEEMESQSTNPSPREPSELELWAEKAHSFLILFEDELYQAESELSALLDKYPNRKRVDDTWGQQGLFGPAGLEEFGLTPGGDIDPDAVDFSEDLDI